MHTVLAASLLGNFLLAHNTTNKFDQLPGHLDLEDLERITAVLEKQRSRSGHAGEEGSRYRVVVFERFERAYRKASSTDSGLARDTMDLPLGREARDARPVVKGPYARSADAAAQAMCAELEAKAMVLCRRPEVVRDRAWVVRPSGKAADGVEGRERGADREVWVGVNVWPVVLKDGADVETEDRVAAG